MTAAASNRAKDAELSQGVGPLPAHRARRQHVMGIVFGDLVATAYATGMGLWLRIDTLYRGEPIGAFHQPLVALGIGLILLAVWNIALWTQGTRNFDVIGSGAREYWEVSQVTGLMFAVVVTISYVFKLEISRGFVLFTFPVGLVLLLTWRWMANRSASRPSNADKFIARAIMLTAANTESNWVAEVNQQFPRLEIAAVLEIEDIHGSIDDIKATALAEDADFIVVNYTLLVRPGLVGELAWALAGFDVRLIALSRLMRRSEPQLTITRMWGERIALIDDLKLSSAQRFKKRGMDLTFTIATMPAWLLLVAILGVLVKLTSRGPMFYSQLRVGQDGAEFKMWKLRTMVQGADAMLEDLLPQNEADGPLFKMENDPRVTWLGRALRKVSLDELPQFWNVLKGDMSLVGPRPQLPSEVRQYRGIENRRHIAQPGLTGLWQISGRSNLDWDDTISLDLEYIQQWSLWLDIWILLRTIPEILRGTGE